MVADPQRQKISVEDYFKLDQGSEIRYEYIDGYAYAMSGGTKAHAWIAMNVARIFYERLQSGPCRVYNSDVRVRLNEKRYVFPDITISCEVADSEEYDDIIRFPRLVVEVLSPTIELYDRVKKFAYYQECLSIQEYVLVSTQRQMIETYYRKGGVWIYRRYLPEEMIDLQSLDIQLPFSAIYERVRVAREEEDASSTEGSEI